MRARKTILVATLGALALAGCTEQTGTNSGARTGAMTGALAGGLIGATSGGSNRVIKTAVGAGIGAGLGGAIGASLDAQAKELRQDMTPGVGIQNTGDQLVVTMPEAITFATDSAVVSASAQRDLAVLANNLMKYPNSTIMVIGHTDSTGSVAHNQSLSERRAASVADVLVNNGVPRWRTNTVGQGPHQPVASNATVEGRAQNRRVEIVIRPTQ